MDNPQQDKQQLLGAANLVFLALFSVTCGVQLFSRVPGTTGPWFFSFYFWIGLFIQMYYYEANVHASGRFDLVPYGAVIGLNITWLALHFVVRQFRRYRGVALHSCSPGVGIFAEAFSWLGNWSGPASDLAVAVMLSGTFFAVDSPIMGGWYRVMVFWLACQHVFIHVRNRILLQRIDDARIDSHVFSDQLKRR